jgi:hypothetical protein
VSSHIGEPSDPFEDPVDRKERVGHIVATDEGVHDDTEPDAVATHVGTDLGGFTAEERAMRIEQAP